MVNKAITLVVSLIVVLFIALVIIFSGQLTGNAIVCSAALNAGTGLSAVYYNSIDFTGQQLNRIDPTVNFAWGYGSPDSNIGSNGFSVIWTGFITPKSTERYTIYTKTDDGVRLWINDNLVINDWTVH